ncbi:MAG: hypothetical protein AAGE59_04250 [Cyanobacteria bacterium P01_F01_bin.86]
MPLSVSQKDSSRIQFAYYAYVAGPMGDVFRYLLRNKAHSTHKGKKMGLAAMSAFWKPFSAQAVLGLSEQEVRAIALTSITELQQQIELIRNTFNIPACSKEITKREIEQMIEEKLNAQRVVNQEPTVQAMPRPNNDNAHR